MTLYRGRYVGGSKTCSGGPTQGARNLETWWLGNYSGLGANNLGIYNCRPVRGSTAPSVHGTGRASDLGCPVGNDWSFAVADEMRAMSAEIGIQCLIHWKPGHGPVIWSCSYPDAGWRDYTGVAQHKEHIHAELTELAGQWLTVEGMVEVLGGRAGTVTLPPATHGRATIKLGSKGDDVRHAQQQLRNNYPLYRNSVSVKRGQLLGVDGDFGAQTDAWVREFQRRSRLVVDGVVGQATWAKLG